MTGDLKYFFYQRLTNFPFFATIIVTTSDEGNKDSGLPISESRWLVRTDVCSAVYNCSPSLLSEQLSRTERLAPLSAPALLEASKGRLGDQRLNQGGTA